MGEWILLAIKCMKTPKLPNKKAIYVSVPYLHALSSGEVETHLCSVHQYKFYRFFHSCDKLNLQSTVGPHWKNESHCHESLFAHCKNYSYTLSNTIFYFRYNKRCSCYVITPSSSHDYSSRYNREQQGWLCRLTQKLASPWFHWKELPIGFLSWILDYCRK